jgi:hypothetical protein
VSTGSSAPRPHDDRFHNWRCSRCPLRASTPATARSNGPRESRVTGQDPGQTAKAKEKAPGTPGHLAAYAGIAPVARRSGTSIRGEFPARSGNKDFKNALFRSAWIASCHDPVSRAYYNRTRAEGKKHNAAVICLARRRCDVIYSMLKHGALYDEKPAQAA